VENCYKNYTQVSTNQYCSTLSLQASHFLFISFYIGESDEHKIFAKVSFFIYLQLQQKLLQLKACLLCQTLKNKLCTAHYSKCVLCTHCELLNSVPQGQMILIKAFPIVDRKPAQISKSQWRL
jgi:hypothetical protein